METNCHKGQQLNYTQTARKAPAEKIGVSGRHEDTRTRESGHSGDERLEILVSFSHAVAGEPDASTVPAETAVTLDDQACAIGN